jgi:hypothetical protein
MSTPVTGPVAAEIESQGLRTQAKKASPVNASTMRMLQSDVLAAVANRFGGERIGQLLDELCEAECITNGGRKIPDNRTRLAAITLVLAYMVGRPVERQEIISVNVDADSEAGMLERLKSSPALRAQLRKVLDAADEVEPVVEG